MSANTVTPKAQPGAAAFTLLEMLIVIVIISILAALSAPALSNVTNVSAVYASASEIGKTLQLAQELAVAFKRPHAVLFNTKESEASGWDSTGKHHWYTLLGPTTHGDGPSSDSYYDGETIDPDGIQIGAHHYLRSGVRFWYKDTDFDETTIESEHIPGFSTDTTKTPYTAADDPRIGSDAVWAYTDFVDLSTAGQTADGMNAALLKTSAIFALPNYQFSRADVTNDGEYPMFIGVVSTSTPDTRYVISAEQNTGRVTIARNARVAW